MKVPSENELKSTGIGKLVNKIAKLADSASDPELIKSISLAKEIVSIWKNACKPEVPVRPN
jgi:hypothetical protein